MKVTETINKFIYRRICAYLQSFLDISRQYFLAYGEILVRVLYNKSNEILESSKKIRSSIKVQQK